MINSVFVNTQGLYQRRRAYNMSYRNDFTCCLGELIPVYWQDLIPNTSWTCRVHGLVRFLPMIAPIMDNVDLYVHFWRASRRILEGEGFTQMITGEDEDWNGVYFTPDHVRQLVLALANESESDTTPITDYLLGDGSIFDMLGYDVNLMVLGNTRKLNARKFCMYFRLLNNWYTNENIEPYQGFKEAVEPFEDPNDLSEYKDPDDSPYGDISDLIANIVYDFYSEYGTAGFATHMWPKDYYTAALPTLQYGLPTYLPLGTSAPVNIPAQSVHLGKQATAMEVDGLAFTLNSEAGSIPAGLNTDLYIKNFSESIASTFGVLTDGETELPINDIEGKLYSKNDSNKALLNATADLSEATAITINELRIANALQVFKEREMRYGRRAPEYYKGFYGVTPGDLRLQLPKFLGGGRLPVNISDVEQTSASESGSPQGNLAGKGTALGAGFAKASCFVAEEELILGLAWLMPKVTYAHCLSRHDTKLNDRFDYYNPSFAHIGEQEVWNYEIFAGVLPANDSEFGYQPRYTEYRFHANEMHGEFKNSLSYWTLGRIFNSAPALNGSFIYMQPEALNRIFAVRETTGGFTYRNVLASLKFSVAMLQPLSRYGTPGLIG